MCSVVQQQQQNEAAESEIVDALTKDKTCGAVQDDEVKSFSAAWEKPK